MPNELIRVDNGRASVSQAVVEVFRILNPIGAAAEIIGTLGACYVEFKRFGMQQADLEARHAMATDMLKYRHSVIVSLFEQREREARSTYAQVDKLVEGYTALTHRAITTSSYDSEVAQGTMIILAQTFTQYHINSGAKTIELAQGLQLGDMRVAATAWRTLEGS